MLMKSKGINVMKYETKKLVSRTFLIYSAVNVIAYAFAHIAYLFANDVSGIIFEYLSFYLSKSVEFLAPPVLATVAFLIYSQRGARDSVIFTFAAASARIFYSLPYYYIIFIYNYGYDSVESILISFGASILVILATVAGIIISALAYFLLLKIQCRRSGKPFSNEIRLPISQAPITDFLARANLPVLTFAVVRFAFSLALELVDTVTFLIEYHADYRPSEIITILANFTLLFILLVVSYLIAAAIRNKLIHNIDGNKADEE